MHKIEFIKKTLGEPFFEIDNILIYNIDCKIALNKISKLSNIVDCTITSPPYNIGKEYESEIPMYDYVNWLVEIIDLIFLNTKPDGAFLLNLGYFKIHEKARAIPIPYLIWDKIKFFLNQEIVWNYGAGVACRNYLSPRNEKILWYVKNQNKYTFNLDQIRDPEVKYPNSKKNGKLRVNTLGKNPSDVWQIAKVTTGANRSSKERTEHPAQFPEDLIQRMILGFTNENDLILDPFIGSGTTAVVAQKYNRLCLGFEINTNYCQTIKNRLLNSQKQLQLTSNKMF